MGLFNTIWSGLKIGYNKVYSERMLGALSTLDLRYRKSKDGILVYKSHAAYKSVVNCFQICIFVSGFTTVLRTTNNV